jgi:hypothetical protein
MGKPAAPAADVGTGVEVGVEAEAGIEAEAEAAADAGCGVEADAEPVGERGNPLSWFWAVVAPVAEGGAGRWAQPSCAVTRTARAAATRALVATEPRRSLDLGDA